jgi:hypothetical protein
MKMTEETSSLANRSAGIAAMKNGLRQMLHVFVDRLIGLKTVARFYPLSPSGPSMRSHGSAMTPERGEGWGEGQPLAPYLTSIVTQLSPCSFFPWSPLTLTLSPFALSSAMGRGDLTGRRSR